MQLLLVYLEVKLSSFLTIFYLLFLKKRVLLLPNMEEKKAKNHEVKEDPLNQRRNILKTKNIKIFNLSLIKGKMDRFLQLQDRINESECIRIECAHNLYALSFMKLNINEIRIHKNIYTYLFKQYFLTPFNF